MIEGQRIRNGGGEGVGERELCRRLDCLSSSEVVAESCVRFSCHLRRVVFLKNRLSLCAFQYTPTGLSDGHSAFLHLGSLASDVLPCASLSNWEWILVLYHCFFLIIDFKIFLCNVTVRNNSTIFLNM